MRNTIIFIICLLTAALSRAQDINLNHNIKHYNAAELEQGVTMVNDSTLVVVVSSMNGFKSRKGLRKKGLKELKMFRQWNLIKDVKQVNESFRGPTGQFGVGPKLTMTFKIIF